jgi:hypothetical protein
LEFCFWGYADYLGGSVFRHAGYFDGFGRIVYRNKEQADCWVFSGYLDFVAVDNELVFWDEQGVYGVFIGVDKLVYPAGGVGKAVYVYFNVFNKAAEGNCGCGSGT